MDCSKCKIKEKGPSPVPYLVHEGCMARNERYVRRLIAIIVFCIILLFASNAAWLLYINQYDFSAQSYNVELNTDSGGNANYIGHDGDVDNGEGVRQASDSH